MDFYNEILLQSAMFFSSWYFLTWKCFRPTASLLHKQMHKSRVDTSFGSNQKGRWTNTHTKKSFFIHIYFRTRKLFWTNNVFIFWWSSSEYNVHIFFFRVVVWKTATKHQVHLSLFFVCNTIRVIVEIAIAIQSSVHIYERNHSKNDYFLHTKNPEHCLIKSYWLLDVWKKTDPTQWRKKWTLSTYF